MRLDQINRLGMCFGFAFVIAMTSGCEKTVKSPGNGNATNSNANKSTAGSKTGDQTKSDADSHGHTDSTATHSENTDMAGESTAATTSDDHSDHDHSHDGHDHEGHDHDGEDHSDAPEAMSDAASKGDPATAKLVDLSSIGITRHPSGTNPDNQRDATADLIYATVRVKMDILIAERKQLLDAGHDTTDPEVRQKEASINRAISLLEENGEKVDPIDPPITQ